MSETPLARFRLLGRGYLILADTTQTEPHPPAASSEEWAATHADNSPTPTQPRGTEEARACVCAYCGHSEAYADVSGPEVRRVRDLMIAHDAACPRNPLVAELTTLRARLAAVEGEGENSAKEAYDRGFNAGLTATIQLRDAASERRGAEAQLALDSDWMRNNGYTEAADMLRLATLFPEAPDA